MQTGQVYKNASTTIATIHGWYWYLAHLGGVPPPTWGIGVGPPQYDPNIGLGPNVGVRVGSKGISLTKQYFHGAKRRARKGRIFYGIKKTMETLCFGGDPPNMGYWGGAPPMLGYPQPQHGETPIPIPTMGQVLHTCSVKTHRGEKGEKSNEIL